MTPNEEGITPFLSPGAHGEHDPHHVEEEFGAISNTTVQFHEGPVSSAGGSECGDEASGKPCSPRQSHTRVNARQLRRLRRKLFAKRWLRQYFPQQGVLMRENVRKERKEEDLYLDLIVVAAVASLSHELRHHFDGWPSVENFILLFAALYSSWRSLMFLWNGFGTKGDLVDKATVFSVQVCMAGIGLGANAAFTTARIPVGIASFLAASIPAGMYGYYSFRAVEASNEYNRFHQGAGYALTNMMASLPYLVAVFIKSETGARICYWLAFGLGLSTLPVYTSIYTKLHIDRPLAVRLAVNIENMTEKYGVLTLVVLGESLMALLFEGSDMLREEGTSVAADFLGVFLGIVIIYSLMTLYFDVDNFHTRDSVHAIRHNRWNGMLWSQMHIFYHMALAGFLSTGIGLMIKDVALEAKSKEAVKLAQISGDLFSAAVHAASNGAKTENEFNSKARWLFSGGWMVATVISSLMGLLHKAGKRGRTKNRRIYPRIVISLLAGVGLPFADISARGNLFIFTAITVLFALVEFVAIRMDEIGMLSRSGSSLSASLTSSSVQDSSDNDSHSDGTSDVSEEMDPSEDTEAVKTVLAEKGGNPMDTDSPTKALRKASRRRRRRQCRFETITRPSHILRHCSQNQN